MQDKKLREKLGLVEGWHDEPSIIERVDKIYKHLFVEDFFKDCPCCNSSGDIPRVEAVEFKRLRHSFLRGHAIAVSYYTTKESYETHKSQIKKWEKEIEDYKKLRK